jgi:hypothetical protein
MFCLILEQKGIFTGVFAQHPSEEGRNQIEGEG